NLRARPNLMRWRASLSHTPAATDNLFSVLSSLLQYGVSIGKLRNNIAYGIGDLYRLGRRAIITWEDREIAMVVAKAHELARPDVADAVSLAALTGLRLGDLITVSWSDVRADAIRKVVEKRHGSIRRVAVIPRDNEVDDLLVKLAS